MHIQCETLDDALLALYPRLLACPEHITASRGSTRELLGVLLEIQIPRARLSRTETRGKPFSCLGELLWYLSKDNRLNFINYYISRYKDETEDGVTVYGGYEPRLFNLRGNDQILNVTKLLQRHPTSRRAIIQLFNAEDIVAHRKEIPCTTTLQFFIRDARVHLVTTMRSNDAYKGLPHDVFCFTMIQEIMARTLGYEIGTYRHFAGSMHLYEPDLVSVKQYVDEAVQPRIQMPTMPVGDPWPAIGILLDAERHIRTHEEINASMLGLDPYWADLVRLLQVFASGHDADRIDALKGSMAWKHYGSYIEDRK